MDCTALLRRYLDESGKLKQYPSKLQLRIAALMVLATKFEPGVNYTERQVNDLIGGNHTFNDSCLLRRELVANKFLSRKTDGSAYWLTEQQPTPADFGLE